MRTLPLLAVIGISISAHAGRLIAIDNSREIYDVNRTTGVKTLIGTASAGAGNPGELARNATTGAIYVASWNLDTLLTLDISTGSAILIGGFGTTTVVMHGMEWDSTQHALWGASNGNLFRIGETNGVAIQIGTSGLTSFTNLGYVPSTDTLYATNIGTDRLYTVDRGSGAFTSVGLLGSTASNASALAYDTDNAVMYMIDNVSDALYTVDLATGAATIVGSTGTGNLQGLVYLPGDTPFIPFCFGNGTGTACPCGNSGANGNGCANSLNPSGARLAASGNASISSDTVTLRGSGMPNSSALYFQGTAQQSFGAGAVFGDGLRCASGTIVRLGTKANVSGMSQYPVAPDFSVSVRGQCAPGDARNYQVWYRNAAMFCTVSTFNLSNGLAVTWVP